ncbi:hypothetical protein [Streptomyces sp. AC550_RSS872]|uniref:hypothetical protein n=1 Tax=Streptomyces sp. AC550_RSS872 TaxID=2823689 RepID=UPI001C26922C|nr:hypothetical protein [Streptomyces sp. AC550_RSS872]
MRVLFAQVDPCRRAPEVKGFHFALTQSTGFDTGHEPEIVFVSPYLETSPGRPMRPVSRSTDTPKRP